MTTKTIKIPIQYYKENYLSEKNFFKELKDIQYKTYIACNRAITYQYSKDMQNMIQMEVGIPRENDKYIFGKSFQAWVENRMKEIMKGCLSNNVAQTRAFVFQRYSQDKKNGLLKGEVSLSQFKRDIPIIIHNNAYSIIDTPKGLGIEIGFFNKLKKRELGTNRFKFLFTKLGGHEKSILIQLMNSSYKQGVIQILYNKRIKKWLVAISYTFEIKNKEVDSNIIMGIDLGITKVATISLYDINKKEYIFMNYKERYINGDELIKYRQKIEARRRNLSIASKWASDNNTGHGYKARMDNVNIERDKYNRYKDTYNHKVSRYIINLAVKYNAGIIQMEDLSGFSEHQNESLLSNWSYYDLQKKIEYKAKEKGIKCIFINPKFTSQRCSSCGYIDKKNRVSQSEFKCINCNHKENADVNASKNIAIPDIENIIAEY